MDDIKLNNTLTSVFKVEDTTAQTPLIWSGKDVLESSEMAAKDKQTSRGT